MVEEKVGHERHSDRLVQEQGTLKVQSKVEITVENGHGVEKIVSKWPENPGVSIFRQEKS